MNQFVDDQIIEEMNSVVRDAVKDAVKFAVTERSQDDEIEEADLRQAAQDATNELLHPLVDAVYEAYHRGVGRADGAAISKVFDSLAVRARLYALTEAESETDVPIIVRLATHQREVEGRYMGIIGHEGQECVRTEGETFTPLSVITSVDVVGDHKLADIVDLNLTNTAFGI